MPIQTPTWVKDAVFYQIFPDRFARGSQSPAMPGISFRDWGAPPEEQGFQGGDLYGVIDKLDYLQDLGINALYFNPVFSSAANHRYHTFDYMQVDPLLGGNDALHQLLDAAHARNIKVVLDGVFNHASRGFWAFHHILETGGNSPYLDWFHIEDWPLNPYPRKKGEPLNYKAWWELPALPKFNTDNPGVRAYLLDVARYWIEIGVDGWRLDVPEEIDDDAFWQEFRQVVKAANPEAYIVGEIWHPAQRWLQGDQFDAVMNYIFSRAVMGFVAADSLANQRHLAANHRVKPLETAADFAAALDDMHALYDWEINHVQLNLLGSHDTPRALWWMGDDTSALQLAAFLQMTMPGAPCIYYGDEIGLTGDTDPHCRAAFPWHEPESWNNDLLDFYRRVTALRNDQPVLRTGDFETVYAEGQLYAFRRRLNETEALVIVNAGTEAQRFAPAQHWPAATNKSLQQIWPLPKPLAADTTLTIPARQGGVLLAA